MMGVCLSLERMALMMEEPRVGLVPPAMAIFILLDDCGTVEVR